MTIGAKEKAIVPELRFSEFDLGKSYNTCLFEDTFLFSTGKNIKQNEASPEYKTPCVRYGELYHLYDEVITQVVNKTNLNESELVFSQGNEILLPSAGEDPLDIGSASALTLKNIAIGRTINVLRPKNEGVYSHVYVSYYINQKLRKKISTLARGASISNVYNSDLKSLKINLPGIKEQQKIATFLISIDDKLNKLRRKRELLEVYKLGLMQKLFSQEIRFKQDDGSDFPGWKKNRIDDLYDWVGTNNLSRANLTLESGKVQNIHYGDIHSKFSSHFNQDKEKAPYIVDSKLLNTLNPNAYCKAGDLIIADASEDYKDIGKSIEIISVKTDSLVAGLHTYIARPKVELSLGFSGYLFQSQDIRKKIKKIAQGVSVLGISKTNLNKIELFLPTPKEQEKITDVLVNIDQKIDATRIKVTQLETFKKGLLQKMFV